MDDEEQNRLAKKFLTLPPEKQQKIHAMMTDLFQKLEKEWKADPNNAGKHFSYSKMWDEYVASQNEHHGK